MRLYAPLLLALFVGAHAATIPEKIQPELEQKIVINDEKPSAENVSNEPEPELTDPANTVVDFENNLKNNLKPEDIPVKVIVEEAQPIVKSAQIEPAYEVVEEEIKRPVVDLRNPGPAQHQEHETQNPEHFEDIERTASTVKGEIQESKVVLRQGFQGVTNGIQNLYSNNEQITNLQNSINSLQGSFAAQIQKLNDTLQNFLKPDFKPLSLEEEKATKTNFENIETGLKTLESNFKAGVQSLSEGVQMAATLRQEGASASSGSDSSSTAAPAGNSNPFQFLLDLVSNLQTSMSSGLNNMSQAVNNFVTQNQPNLTLPSLQNIFQQNTVAPLADTPVDGSSTTPRPSAWQNIQTSFNNIFNPNQASQNVQNDQPTPAPTGPFGIPPFPIITSIVNLIQRPGAQSTVKPTQTPQADPVPTLAPQSNPVPEGSNAVPTPVKPEEIIVKPESEKKPEPSVNPIRKVIENSAIGQGIDAAVQRIQSINNPDKPRDTAVDEAVKAEEVKSEEMKPEGVKPEDVKVEEVKPEPEIVDVKKVGGEQEKGGWYYPPKPNHGGSDDSSSRLETSSEQTEKVSENKENIKETEQVSDKTE